MGMPCSGPGLAARERRVGRLGRRQAALEIAHADGVERTVVPLDAADRVLRQLDRRDFLRRQCCRQFGGGPETPLRFGQACS